MIRVNNHKQYVTQSMLTKTAVRDKSGFTYPIDEIQRAIQSLRKQRDRVAQMPPTYTRREELLCALEEAIAKREAMIRQVVNTE